MMKVFPHQETLDKIPPELHGEFAVGTLRISDEVLQQIERGEDDVFLPVTGHAQYVINSNTLGISRKRIDGTLKTPMRPFTNVGGYQQVSFKPGGPGSKPRLHTVVKNTLFVNPDPEKFNTVEHLDCNPGNNNPSNLVFATMKFQCHPSNKKPNPKSGAEKLSRRVHQFTKQGVFIKEFDSLTQAAIEVTGDVIKGNNIGACALGKQKTAYGFVWRFPVRDDGPGEAWKVVPSTVLSGRDAPYQVSNLGRMTNRHGQQLVGTLNCHGYIRVTDHALLHRVVALTWIPNPRPDQFDLVGHADDIKENCAVENLYWTDVPGNGKDAHKTGASGPSTVQIKATWLADGTTRVFNSRKEAAAEFNVSPTTIASRIKYNRVIDGVRLERASENRRHHG